MALYIRGAATHYDTEVRKDVNVQKGQLGADTMSYKACLSLVASRHEGI